MASFDKAFDTIFKHERGYANDPNDPGGETMHGISKRRYPTLDIPNITKEVAKGLYYQDFWIRYHFDAILSQEIATKVADTGVNIGPNDSIRCLQYAVRAVDGTVLSTDGILGPKSLAAINRIGDEACGNESLMSALKAELRNEYVKGHSVYIKSLLKNRVYS